MKYLPLLILLAGCTTPNHDTMSRSMSQSAPPSIEPTSRVCVIVSPGHGPVSAFDTTNQREIYRWLVVESSTDLVNWSEVMRDTNAVIFYRTNSQEFFRAYSVFE